MNDVDFDSKGDLLGETFFLRRSLLSSHGLSSHFFSDLFIKVWDTQNDWRTSRPWRDMTTPYRLPALSGDQFIVSASRDRTIRVFDVSSTFVIRFIFLVDP